jgi:hypothetical protein
MGITNTPSTSEISNAEYQSSMDFFGGRMKERRESSVIGIANDILEEINTSPECGVVALRLRNIHIGHAYVTMEAVCCMLYRCRNICASYTIKVKERTEGTKNEERGGQSNCHYTLDVWITAFKGED